MTCVSLLVGMLRSHKLCLPLSFTALRRYFPSGEIAAATDSLLFVIWVIVTFLEGHGSRVVKDGINNDPSCAQNDQGRYHHTGRSPFVLFRVSDRGGNAGRVRELGRNQSGCGCLCSGRDLAALRAWGSRTRTAESVRNKIHLIGRQNFRQFDRNDAAEMVRV